jgi:hypothetical protein
MYRYSVANGRGGGGGGGGGGRGGNGREGGREREAAYAGQPRPHRDDEYGVEALNRDDERVLRQAHGGGEGGWGGGRSDGSERSGVMPHRGPKADPALLRKAL